MRIAFASLVVSAIAPGARSAEGAAISISQFVAQPPPPGAYTLSGYVVDTFLCPPCPKGAQCKPCPGDSIRLSDNPPPAVPANGPTLTVFATPAEIAALKLGGLYRIRVESGAQLRFQSADRVP